jgi:acetyl esterase/lipase
MIKFRMVIFSLLLMFNSGNIQAETWQPSSDDTQIPLWPAGKMPDALPDNTPESFVNGELFNVSKPTITIYSPKTKNSGVTIVVFPGGGFNGLAINFEGTEICHWLTRNGTTCVLLKYRVPDSGPAWHNDCHCNIHPKAPTALQDAQRTMGLLRVNASKWGINPNKIGVLGFSAGGYMVPLLSTHFKKRAYTPIDAADKESCRPDFAVALYPGHMEKKKGEFILNPEIHFTKEAPPTLIVQAENDPMDNINNSLLYYIGLKDAGVPVEMHLYAEGGHAFGIRRTKFTITEWPDLLEKWLSTIGITSRNN